MRDPRIAEEIRTALADELAHRFGIDAQIGEGGMGIVFRAHDMKHERPVAIKVLRRRVSASLGAPRFLREIQITARLSHPNILPLIDSGEVAGLFYFVTPFVEGESLRAMALAQGGIPFRELMPLVREIGEALDFAHRNNVVHRDIKPDNVFLMDGHAVLADFGLARAMDAAGGPELTESGIALGSPAYMSPEQALGARTLDGRSDQYSFACLTYELLTTRLPFDAEDVPGLFKAHAKEAPPDVRELKPEVPEEVAKAIRQAMSKVPADRFESVSEFVRAMESGATAPRRRSVSIGWIVVAATVLFGLAVLVGTLLS